MLFPKREIVLQLHILQTEKKTKPQNLRNCEFILLQMINLIMARHINLKNIVL